MPVVSVVVIGYNDAANLEVAVRSAAAQTLHDIEIVVVDDASTDATPDVTRRLAAADRRVRVVRLPQNSGGCSRPRNVGIEHASGRYVTFLDSDDVLHRRACERLLSGALRADADMACGRYLRRHHTPRRYIAAHDELYLQRGVLTTILDRPEQLRDTPCCSKLYRRRFLDDNGLRFPEGLLFEDLLFTTQAYCTAQRIAIVPELVYIWNVRRDASAPSITNRRDLRNWRDRFEVHRRIDDFLAAHTSGDAIRAAKDRKFLDVDLAWFLRQLRDFPADQRPELLDSATAYVAGLHLVRQRDAATGARIGAFLTARGDLERTLLAADYVATGQIGSDVVERDGAVVWTAAYADDETARTVLDVTPTGLRDADFATTPFLTVAGDVTHRDGRLTVIGHVHDVLGRLSAAGSLDAHLEVSGRVGGTLWWSRADLDVTDGGLRWFADVDLAAVGRRLVRPTVGHELRLHLRLRSGTDHARLAVSARDARLPDAELTLPSPMRLLVGDRVRVVERNGRLVLALTGLPRYVDAAIDAASLARYVGRRGWLKMRVARSAASVSMEGEGE